MTKPLVIEVQPNRFMAFVGGIQLPATESLVDLAASLETETWTDEVYCFLHCGQESPAQMLERHLKVRMTLRAERHRLRWADFEPPY